MYVYISHICPIYLLSLHKIDEMGCFVYLSEVLPGENKFPEK